MPEIAIDGMSSTKTDVVLRGVWWTPAESSIRVGGSLAMEHGVGGTLQLDGALWRGAAPAGPIIIHGNSDGKAITIGEAHYRGQTMTRDVIRGGEEIIQEDWACLEVYAGTHSNLGRAQTFSTFALQLMNLGAWVNKPKPEIDHNEDRSVVLRLEMPDPLSADIPGLGTLTLWWQDSSSIGNQKAWVKMIPTLELRPLNLMTAEDAWIRFVTPSILFSTLVLGTPDRVSALTGTIGDLNSPENLEQVEFYLTQWADAPPGPMPRWVGEHLLTFADVEDRFSEVIPAWFGLVGTSRESFLDFFARSITPFLYVEEEFVRISRAMESWHRREFGGTYMPEDEFANILQAVKRAVTKPQWEFVEMRMKHANERTLKQRLDQLLVEAGEPVLSLVGLYKRFARKVVNTRNRLTHEGAIGEDFSEVELFWASKTLVHIFQSILLKRLGYTSDEVRMFVERSSDWKQLSNSANPLADWSKYSPRRP